MPLFRPNPTILPTRLGPAPPNSQPSLSVTGQLGFPGVGRAAPKPQVPVKVSILCSFFDHLICPLFKSNARAVSKKSSAAVQFELGVASWQASTAAGAV